MWFAYQSNDHHTYNTSTIATTTNTSTTTTSIATSTTISTYTLAVYRSVLNDQIRVQCLLDCGCGLVGVLMSALACAGSLNDPATCNLIGNAFLSPLRTPQHSCYSEQAPNSTLYTRIGATFCWLFAMILSHFMVVARSRYLVVVKQKRCALSYLLSSLLALSACLSARHSDATSHVLSYSRLNLRAYHEGLAKNALLCLLLVICPVVGFGEMRYLLTLPQRFINTLVSL